MPDPVTKFQLGQRVDSDCHGLGNVYAINVYMGVAAFKLKCDCGHSVTVSQTELHKVSWWRGVWERIWYYIDD